MGLCTTLLPMQLEAQPKREPHPFQRCVRQGAWPKAARQALEIARAQARSCSPLYTCRAGSLERSRLGLSSLVAADGPGGSLISPSHKLVDWVLGSKPAGCFTDGTAGQELTLPPWEAHQELEQAWQQTELLQRQLMTAVEVGARVHRSRGASHMAVQVCLG